MVEAHDQSSASECLCDEFGRRLSSQFLGGHAVGIGTSTMVFGCTPLHYAAGSDRLDVVQWLPETGGATIDEKDEEDTPLLFAARGGSLETVQWLLEHGASLQEKNAQGESAVDLLPGNEKKRKLLQLDLGPRG